MPPIVNVADFFKIGVLAFLFIYFANSVLRSIGRPNLTTTGE